MLKVKISRKRWAKGVRGEGRLYKSHDRKMCCLGFAMRAAGHKVSEIKDNATPGAIEGCKINSLIFANCNSDICFDLMDMNDNPLYSDIERESELKRLGKQADIEFEFVD